MRQIQVQINFFFLLLLLCEYKRLCYDFKSWWGFNSVKILKCLKIVCYCYVVVLPWVTRFGKQKNTTFYICQGTFWRHRCFTQGRGGGGVVYITSFTTSTILHYQGHCCYEFWKISVKYKLKECWFWYIVYYGLLTLFCISF